MTAPPPLKNASDSYVSEKFPSKNYNSVSKLFLADGSSADTRYAYIYFGLPSGLVGTTILPTKFRLYSGAGFSGSVTVTVQRLTSKFSTNRVNWNNKPTSTSSGQVAVAKTSAPAGTMWEFDVTSMIQTVANGAPWYGFRISATGSGAKWFYSAQGLDKYRPTLEVVWSDSPDTPERLIPDNGQAVSVAKPTLQWDFVDPSGDQSLQSAQLRMFSTQALADANTTPDIHDVLVPTTVPEYDLDAVGTRTQTGVTTTSASTTVGAPAGAFTAKDVGETITGTGIPPGATIVSQTGNAAVLSAAATATGTVTASIGVSYPGLAADATIWWRVLNTDGAGLPSGWSEPAFFTRKTKGTVAITNPAAGSPAFVNDSTPPFSWTFTGRTQQKYEVLLTTPETPADYIWTSGIITSTDLAVTPPPGKITVVGKTYRLIVRIYDTENRIAVPDDPIYAEATRDFVYQFASSVTPVTGLTLSLDPITGRATMDWASATAPDEFVINRDGQTVLTDQPVDLLVSGTAYRYIDDEAAPRKSHIWEVARKVNGVTSSGNPTVQGTPKVIAPILSQIGGTKPVVFLNPDVDAERVESSDIHYILGDAPPILITQSIRGYEGTISGILSSDSGIGLTADQMLDNLEEYKRNPGQVLKFVWINKVMRVVVRNITDQPLVYPNGTVDYLASFDFFEVGF